MLTINFSMYNLFGMYKRFTRCQYLHVVILFLLNLADLKGRTSIKTCSSPMSENKIQSHPYEESKKRKWPPVTGSSYMGRGCEEPSGLGLGWGVEKLETFEEEEKR